MSSRCRWGYSRQGEGEISRRGANAAAGFSVSRADSAKSTRRGQEFEIRPRAFAKLGLWSVFAVLLGMFLQYLEGFLPVAALVWVLLLRRFEWQRVLATSAVTAAVPFLVMTVVWLTFRTWPGVQIKTLGTSALDRQGRRTIHSSIAGRKSERARVPTRLCHELRLTKSDVLAQAVCCGQTRHSRESELEEAEVVVGIYLVAGLGA